MVLYGNGKLLRQVHFKFRQGSPPGPHIHITEDNLSCPGGLVFHDPDAPLLEFFQIIMQSPGWTGLRINLKPSLQMLPDRLTYGPAPHQPAGNKDIFPCRS
jgi:hypothetical protein